MRVGFLHTDTVSCVRRGARGNMGAKNNKPSFQVPTALEIFSGATTFSDGKPHPALPSDDEHSLSRCVFFLPITWASIASLLRNLSKAAGAGMLVSASSAGGRAVSASSNCGDSGGTQVSAVWHQVQDSLISASVAEASFVSSACDFDGSAPRVRPE